MMMMKSGPGVTAPSSAAPGVRFPEKLHSFLTMASTDPFLCQVISWLPGGAAFKIHDVTIFTAAVLPRHFTGMNSFKSFRRQLNLYGIRNQRRSDLDSATLLVSSEEEREGPLLVVQEEEDGMLCVITMNTLASNTTCVSLVFLPVSSSNIMLSLRFAFTSSLLIQAVLIGAYFHPLLQRDHKELIVRMTRASRNNPPKGFKDERKRR